MQTTSTLITGHLLLGIFGASALVSTTRPTCELMTSWPAQAVQNSPCTSPARVLLSHYRSSVSTTCATPARQQLWLTRWEYRSEKFVRRSMGSVRSAVDSSP